MPPHHAGPLIHELIDLTIIPKCAWSQPLTFAAYDEPVSPENAPLGANIVQGTDISWD
jgi:hypothetical protein